MLRLSVSAIAFMQSDTVPKGCCISAKPMTSAHASTEDTKPLLGHGLTFIILPMSGLRSPPWNDGEIQRYYSELEAILLRATEPPYNVKIPMER